MPVEVNLDAYRLAKQNDLSAVDYYDLTMDNIDEVSDKRIQALKEIERDKLWVARAYNKKVRPKSFQVGDLVWKTILPLGTKRSLASGRHVGKVHTRLSRLSSGIHIWCKRCKESVYSGLLMEDT